MSIFFPSIKFDRKFSHCLKKATRTWNQPTDEVLIKIKEKENLVESFVVIGVFFRIKESWECFFFFC